MQDAVRQIRSELAAILSAGEVYEAARFALRAEVLDALEFRIAARIEALLLDAGPLPELTALQQEVAAAQARLEAIDDRLFARTRAAIRSGEMRGADLRRQIERYALLKTSGSERIPAPEGQERDGRYDHLDAFVGGLLLPEPVPAETRARDPEMVPYQPTPARVILALAERITRHDVFYDIGSGLGQVAILVHLLAGAEAHGVEVEPAYTGYARRRARELDLAGVKFRTADARRVDYGRGSAFFLYTPCWGHMLQAVLDRLAAVARRKKIAVYTYGPCSVEVSRQGWLAPGASTGGQRDELAAFESIPVSPYHLNG